MVAVGKIFPDFCTKHLNTISWFLIINKITNISYNFSGELVKVDKSGFFGIFFTPKIYKIRKISNLKL